MLVLRFTEQDGTKAVPKGSEALLVMEADLEKQFEDQVSIKESTAVTDVRLYPFALHDGLCRGATIF